MIDAREPKNGDFVSYVENLSKMPVGQSLPHAPDDAFGHGSGGGSAKAPGPAPGAGAQRGHEASPILNAESAKRAIQELLKARSERLGTSGPAGHEFSHQVGRVLSRVAAIATLAGIALIAMSFSDSPPFFADPVLGIGLVVMGAVANRLSRKLA
jgi:hypothetical protein